MLLLLACAAPPEGLRETPDGTGPVVTVDWDARPLADIPFPNDLATRADLTSPTGLRLNIPLAAETESEAEARAKLDQLTGFGVYSPISVGFRADLDLDDIAARHRDDPLYGDARYADDAIYLIDVDPDSPDQGRAIALDLGEGRYPMDAARGDRYFPNDSRAGSPSLIFDTVDEDTNQNGVLDWGEDTDNDGILDIPNVYPAGGDPRADLLTWYERTTHTLILRPTMPLREETTYAVVLTDRLVGADGAPVRSPWAYVNHLAQTDALRPLEGLLPRWGLSLDHVAFTWAFTTGRVTGDLVDIHRGLEGDGPFASLQQEYPAGVQEALQMHNLPDGSDPYRLPASVLVQTLGDLGLFEGESAEVLTTNYAAFAESVVGGSFTTPDFLADRDDNGHDDSEEWFDLDAWSGRYAAQPRRVVFTCVLPKAREGVQAPFPVVLFGHGYGSSRFDFLGFSWAFARLGYAACAIDFPGHGPTIDDDQLELVETVLDARGLLPFLVHLQDSRYRDLNNDGVPDSGGDQWTADAFHTRDMVRQAAVDWGQLVHSFMACGTGTMTRSDGVEVTACDWDDDGAPDIGGPDVRYAIVGGSLGGINTGVAAGTIPEVESFAAIASGGGLLDVAVRTEIGGAVEAMAGRLLTPLFLGYPTGDGGLRVVQMVNSVTDMVELPVATLPSFPAGGRVEVENVDKGILREGYIPTDGSFRLPVPADGLDAYEKRKSTGMADSGPEIGVTYEVPENEGLGDHLVVRLYDSAGTLVHTLDTFEADVVHEGVTMRAGSPLVAGSHGSGHIRASPEARRLISAMAAILEPGDPIAYAPHYITDPYVDLGGYETNVMIVPTPGDTIVNTSTGIAHARAAGYIPQDEVDPRLGVPVVAWLAAHGVIEGLEEYGPYTDVNGASCLYDPDDLDNGTDGTGAPSDVPLRLTVNHAGGLGALRMPYVETTGTHAFGLPEPSRAFDINTFQILQIASYLVSGGRSLSDDRCLEDATCAWIPALPESP